MSTSIFCLLNNSLYRPLNLYVSQMLLFKKWEILDPPIPHQMRHVVTVDPRATFTSKTQGLGSLSLRCRLVTESTTTRVMSNSL